MSNKIIIIGGGISGITTALMLQLLGYDTTVYAEYLVGDAPDDPRFASCYPAASIIPHSVQTGYLDILFPDSQKVFEALFKKGFPGMKIHRHFEVFEFTVNEPKYTSFLKNYTLVQYLDEDFLPKRNTDQKLYGWAFDCYIAEFPVYIKQLYKLYKQKGGTILKKNIKRDEVKELQAEVVINCSGIWSNELFEDRAAFKITRGHIVHVLNKSKIKNANGHVCSYNYTPDSSVYASPGGDFCDVYFYPIGDKWVLGGSREIGLLDENNQWKGRGCDETIKVDGKEIPAQIIELNKAILENTYQANLQFYKELKSFIGYRFERDDPHKGLRLEKTEEFSKTIIHNYGHGGAGVTLSWGCALRVAELLEESISSSSPFEGGKELLEILRERFEGDDVF